MRRFNAIATLFMVLLLPASCTMPHASESFQSTSSDNAVFLSIPNHPQADLCGPVRVGGMRCHAKMRTDLASNASPQGFGASDLQSAYGIPMGGGAGQTVAIIDANDDPNAESDLATYRAQFGLPACTTQNGCFKKVNQNGEQASYPPADSGWAGEISLDLDMVSAGCPSCKIILVEANSATTDDLGAAVNTAATLGANAISNSYGGPEGSIVTSESSEYYDHPGILVTASAGDQGYGAQFPASSQYVISVGGTSLVKTSSTARGWAESAWNGGGSGCSAFIPKPAWQTDTGCGMRTMADVAAVADANTGVSVYDSYGGQGGWNVYGGTSAAAPLMAAIFTAAGIAGSPDSYAYAHASTFNDVIAGENGKCGGSYLCTAGPGYDGPTGLGTPNGVLLGGGTTASAPDAGSPIVDSGMPPPPPVDAASPIDSGSVEVDAGSGGACTHPLCSPGSTLTPSCDRCAASICASDSYCCNSQWDSQCVAEVSSICGDSCGSGGQVGSNPGSGASSCSHPICNAGGKLDPTCDPCAADVCNTDSYCCTTLWDKICASEVTSVCGQTCP